MGGMLKDLRRQTTEVKTSGLNARRLKNNPTVNVTD